MEKNVHVIHLYISYNSSSFIYVDLIAPVANVICYFTISTLNKYFLSYFILSHLTLYNVNQCRMSEAGLTFKAYRAYIK